MKMDHTKKECDKYCKLWYKKYVVKKFKKISIVSPNKIYELTHFLDDETKIPIFPDNNYLLGNCINSFFD